MGSYQSVIPDVLIFEPTKVESKSNGHANGSVIKKSADSNGHVNGQNGDAKNLTSEDPYLFDENYEGDKADDNIPYKILWHMVAYWTITHLASFYALYLAFTTANWYTIIFTVLLHYGAGVGIPAGTHRLWSHKSYKAKSPLKALYVIMCSISASGCIYGWCVIHRIHHKYSDTDADPVNAKKGFFFCHIGWTMRTAHPKVAEKARSMDFSDLEKDVFVQFQRKYFTILTAIFCFAIPTIIPVYFWNEDPITALVICGVLRHVLVMHGTFTINSVAHLWGRQPYNKDILPRENWLANLYSVGEGYHNYHHSFPYDYRASEFGWKFNLTTMFIDIMSTIGWAYDLRFPNGDMVRRTKLKKGDVNEKGYYGPN